MRDRDQLTNYLLIPLDKRRIRVFLGIDMYSSLVFEGPSLSNTSFYLLFYSGIMAIYSFGSHSYKSKVKWRLFLGIILIILMPKKIIVSSNYRRLQLT